MPEIMPTLEQLGSMPIARLRAEIRKLRPHRGDLGRGMTFIYMRNALRLRQVSKYDPLTLYFDEKTNREMDRLIQSTRKRYVRGKAEWRRLRRTDREFAGYAAKFWKYCLENGRQRLEQTAVPIFEIGWDFGRQAMRFQAREISKAISATIDGLVRNKKLRQQDANKILGALKLSWENSLNDAIERTGKNLSETLAIQLKELGIDGAVDKKTREKLARRNKTNYASITDALSKMRKIK